MKQLGYIKSTDKDDSLDEQKKELKKEGCSIVYKDVVSSAKVAHPGFDTLLDSVENDDVVVIHSLDRLGSSLNQVIDNVDRIHQKGGRIKSLKEKIDTSEGESFFECITILKDTQSKIFQERTKPGRTGAKARGRMGGRPEKLTEEQIAELKTLYENNLPVNDICKKTGISRPTLYKYLKR